jgi:hypothetical protein
VETGKQQKSKSEAKSLDVAISTLVKSLKHDLQKKYGRVDYAHLRKSGYSDMMLDRLKEG